MDEHILKNKKAWEYKAYEYWNSRGTPAEKAAYIKQNPLLRLRYHQKYFTDINNKKIVNICGSNGRIAAALALLGADVTIFDISEENRRYALELAKELSVSIEYILGDFCSVDKHIFSNKFDIAYAEGGILHYFFDLKLFMNTVYSILKENSKFILSDFHPFRKINRVGSAMMSVAQTEGDYFDENIHIANVAYQDFFSDEDQQAFPKCNLRFYNISEIMNSVINAGFEIKEFNEHPNFENKKLPGEFTILAVK